MKKIKIFLVAIILIQILQITALSKTENGKLVIKTTPLHTRIDIFKDNKLFKRNITNNDGILEENLPKGKYQIIISKGLEYKPYKKDIVIKEKELNLNVNIEKVYDMQAVGWYSGDAHLHSQFSDGAQKFPQVVLGAKAEGLNWIVPTEHNEGASKLWKHLQKNNYNTDDFCVIFGEEVTTFNLGHFNAIGIKGYVFPVVETAKEIFDNTHKYGGLVVINHPFAGDLQFRKLSSYLWQVNADEAEFFDNFDGIEVWNSNFGWDDEETLRYWFKLLNEGKRYFAIASTDSHNIFTNPLGIPRTYVYLGDKKLTQENILSALKNCNAFLTSGPLVQFTIKDKIPGETAKCKKNEELELNIKVQGFDIINEIQVIKDGFIYFNSNKEVIYEGNVEGYTPELGYEHIEKLKITPKKNSWYVVRVKTKSGLQAITNPIWVELEE